MTQNIVTAPSYFWYNDEWQLNPPFNHNNSIKTRMEFLLWCIPTTLAFINSLRATPSEEAVDCREMLRFLFEDVNNTGFTFTYHTEQLFWTVKDKHEYGCKFNRDNPCQCLFHCNRRSFPDFYAIRFRYADYELDVWWRKERFHNIEHRERLIQLFENLVDALRELTVRTVHVELIQCIMNKEDDDDLLETY
jgi:hypothetical protein